MADKVFPMTRGGASPYYVFLTIGVLLLALSAAFVYFVVGPKQLTVGDRSLEVSGSMYGTTVARDQIRAEQVRVVDLERETDLSPTRRTNGLDLFSYQEGWFRLRTGDKAFLVVSDPSSVVYIPTSAGYAILFSASDPEAVAAALR